MLWEVDKRTWVGVQVLERYKGGFWYRKTLMLWSDLVRIDMGGTNGLIPFVSFPKEAIIEENQNGIGLG